MSQLRKKTSFLLRQTALHRMVMQHHPDIGQLYVPNINARIPNELGGYYIRTNKQGFRSHVDFYPEKGEKPRILFFGDSFTAGFGVDNQQRFSDLIGKELDAEVFNFGLTGSGTDQQLLIYEKFAKEIEADLIVFGVMVENIERNLNSHHRTIDRYTGEYVYTPKPYFKLVNGQLVRYHNPVPTTRLSDEPDTMGTAKREVNSTRHRLLNGLRELYYHPKFEFIRGDRRPSILQNDLVSRFLQVAQFQPYPDYLSPDTPGWQLLAALLRRFREQVSPDIPMLVVPIPDSFFYRTMPAAPIYQDRFQSLHDPEHGMFIADVTTAINQLSSEEKAQVPFKHDFHFSPYGNRLMAKLLVDEIRQHRWLSEGGGENGRYPISSNGSGSQSDADRYILGISCFYHNSAACLLKNGRILAAAEEERFSRIKHDRNFPHRAINYCLEEAGIQQNALDAIVYYDNAYQTFERLLHTQLAIGKAGEEAWMRVIPSWLQYKLAIPAYIRSSLKYKGTILHNAHHRSHAASAFFPSPFARAAILTIDGVGEWATASISHGVGSKITMLKEMHFPHSVGLLYSAFTQFIGFKVNNGEYKMMGLAPYGTPKYVDLITKHLVGLKDDGSIVLNMEYFAFLSQSRMTNEKFAALFDGPARHPDDPITQREMDIARSVQVVTEEIVIRMAQHAYELTGEKYLCLAGGVALNCVANGRLLREGPFEDIWIQPAAGDAGCALGAAIDIWHTYYSQPRLLPENGGSLQQGSYWGPSYSDAEIKAFLQTFSFPYRYIVPEERAQTIARFIENGKVLGHFCGRLEYGPRALGSRSILGDARNQEMQTTINLKIKYRESFRPFAPTVLAECISEYFELDRESPYMLLVAPVATNRRTPFERGEQMTLFDIVKQPRSDVPAITHVDYSARIQSVTHRSHPHYYAAINAFREQTGYGVIVNTSFNVRGEPIVCSPYDAYRCFMRTEMDVLMLGNFLLLKEDQPEWPEEKGHIEKYDPSAVAPINDGPFSELLQSIFVNDFLPIAEKVSENGSQRVPTAAAQTNSTWRPYPKTLSNGDIFRIPAALDSSQPDIKETVQAMADYWQHDEINAVLEPVVEKLLQVGYEKLSLAEDEEVVEAITDFVYVMY